MNRALRAPVGLGPCHLALIDQALEALLADPSDPSLGTLGQTVVRAHLAGHGWFVPRSVLVRPAAVRSVVRAALHFHH